MNMTQAFLLESLIKPSEGGPQQGTQDLSEIHRGSLPQWDAAALRVAERMSEVLRMPIAADVEISVTEHKVLRDDEGVPGLLLPLEPADSGAMIRFPDNSATVLANMLLFDPGEDPEQNEADALDAGLAEEVVEILSFALNEALDLPLQLVGEKYTTAWPLTPPPVGFKLLAEFKLSFGEGRQAAIQIIFPSLEHDSLAKFSDPAGGIDPERITFNTEAIIARWQARAISVADLKVGALLPLPGASVQSVRIETETGGQRRLLAEGALGEIHGQRRLTINR